jgi:nucleotide-binding universal stress UspA family protein
VKPPETILLPLDVHKCPLEVFSYINQFGEFRTTVVLLHVLHLNVVPPDGRVFDELAGAAEKDLRRLSEKFLDPRLRVRCEVRFGKPADGIVKEARESNADLIALATYGNSSFWKHPFHPRTVAKVLRLAHCDVMLLHVRTRFNCEDDWLYVDEFASAMRGTGLSRVPRQLLV